MEKKIEIPIYLLAEMEGGIHLVNNKCIEQRLTNYKNMKIENIIKFRDWLFDFTKNMTDDHILGEQEILFLVKDKFSSLGLNGNKIDEESIDEGELDKLAKSNIPKFYEEGDEWSEPFIYGFKVGYRKAKEEYV